VYFIAVLLDETTDVSNKAHFFVAFRYVPDGEIKERFLGVCGVSCAELSQNFLSIFN
jgi:hypothetical protein